jgi:alkylation response protein AidB-like acyl-CoA dehydrogenase
MDFELTEEQKMLKQMVHEFVEKKSALKQRNGRRKLTILPKSI